MSPVRHDAPLVDRARELEVIARFHDARQAGSAALVIGGEPGSGRTALLDAAVAGAGAATMVLRTRPQREEATQPFVALRDLLRPVDDPDLSGVPAPLRAVLDGALLRRVAAPGDDPSLVPQAVAATLTSLAVARDVLLVLDDAEWLDPDTGRCLRFAINRLTPRVSIAVVHGEDADPVPLLAIDRAIQATRTFRIVGRPLSLAGVHHVLTASFGELPRRTVQRAAAASGGNPRAAIELARAAIESAPADRARVPESVGMLVERRLGQVSPGAEHVVLLVAVAG